MEGIKDLQFEISVVPFLTQQFNYFPYLLPSKLFHMHPYPSPRSARTVKECEVQPSNCSRSTIFPPHSVVAVKLMT